VFSYYIFHKKRRKECVLFTFQGELKKEGEYVCWAARQQADLSLASVLPSVSPPMIKAICLKSFYKSIDRCYILTWFN